MRSKEKPIVGQIIEVLSGGRYMVRMGDLDRICYSSGRMKFNHIGISLYDRVEVILDPFGGKATNRIVKRL